MDKKIFKKIINAQVSDLKRKTGSDYLINTSKTKKETYLQVNNMIYDISIKINERSSFRYRNNRTKL